MTLLFGRSIPVTGFCSHPAAVALLLLALPAAFAQTAKTAAPDSTTGGAHYQLAPAFDTAVMDTSVDPCQDMYKFACGNYAAHNPIPADQSAVDQFYTPYNVNTERLRDILTRYSKPADQHTPNQQKIGDDYAACMDSRLIDEKGLEPLKELMGEIDRVTKPGLPYFSGELQRIGVTVFFSYGEMADYKDASNTIAAIDQGGLGLPERDYYTRNGEKDKTLRQQYVEYIAKMLTLGTGEAPDAARADAAGILAFETKLAEASQTVTARRDPDTVYHMETLSAFNKSLHGVPFGGFFEAIHSPEITSLNVVNPPYFPAMVAAIMDTPLPTLRAYLRFHLLSAYASVLPTALDNEHFHFYGTQLQGQPEQQPRWKRCSSRVDSQLGEALGQVYVQEFFGPEQKADTLRMVHDIEAAMDEDINHLDWMSAATKVKAKAKLAMVTDKIGYPNHWRNYSALQISPTDAFGDQQRAKAFDNDREMAKIGKPVDKLEWGMTPPTINAYYDPSENNINFPAGILQPVFYDPHADIAVNYGHIGAVVGHELTHGFDDEGAKFDGSGNLVNWFTPADEKNFENRTGCIASEYDKFIAVDDVHVNGKLTLGEDTADNGGLTLAYIAYLKRAQEQGVDLNKKVDGYTGPQRFYIAYAQNWCENSRPEIVRQMVLTDPHAPNHFRTDGVIVNQPGFAKAFSCKPGSPMSPTQSCHVW